MKKHSNGRENATQLEQRLSEYGATYHHADDNGFTVVGPDRIFIVNEKNPTSVEGFSFRKIPFDNVESFEVERGAPDDRYSCDDAEKADAGNSKPITHIRLWLPSDAVDCYVDADPREVASSFITLAIPDDE